MSEVINNQEQTQDNFDFPLVIEDITNEEFQELKLAAEAKPYQIYNSLSKREKNPVNEIVGWGDVVRLIYAILDEHTKPDLYPMTRFQVCTAWQSTKEKPKPDQGTPCNARGWGAKYPKPNYEGIAWVTVETTVNVKAEMRKAGLATRGGIKEGGNDLKNWVGAQFIYFDLDDGELLSIEQTLACCIDNFIDPYEVSYSPSGSPELPKLRLGIELDEFCTDYDRLDSIAKRICQVLPNAAMIHDPARFYYGTLRPSEMYVNNQAVNKLEFLEENLPELVEEPKEVQQQVKGKESSNEQDVTNSVRLFYSFLSMKLGFDVQQEPTRLVDLFINLLNEKKGTELKAGEWFDRGSQNGSINSWNGTNPIKGSDSGRGDSFVISIQADGSLTFNVDHGSFGSDLLELFYYLNYGSFDCAKMIKAGFYQNLRNICELLDLSYQEFIDYKSLNLGEFYFPSHKAAHITKRGNFLLTFGCPPDDMKFDHAREQFYKWGKNDQDIWYWQPIEQGKLEARLMETFKEVRGQDRHGNETTPMADTKHVKEAIDTMKIELGVSEMSPLEPCLSLKNGILLLNPDGTREPKLIPHGENTKQYNLTYCSPVAYDPTDRPEDNEHLQAVLSNIPDPVHLDVMLCTLAAGLDIKGFAASGFDYLRMILFVGTKGRGGKDTLKLAATLLVNPLRVGSTSIADYGDKNHPEKRGDCDQFDWHWNSENNKMTRADQFDDMPDLKADITWNTRRFRVLHKNWRIGRTIAIMIQHLNCDAQFDTSKGAVKDRLAVVVSPFYYTTADDPMYNPNNPYHRLKNSQYANEKFVAENVSPALLNLLLDYYHKIWHEGYKPNYSYMSIYVQKNLEENKHIYRAVNDIGLTIASDIQHPLATGYIKTLYYAWCIANNMLEGEIRGWSNERVNPDELREPEDYKKVCQVLIDKIQNDRGDTDPIASNDKHFRAKLRGVFEGSIDFATEGRAEKVTRKGRSVTLGLTVGWGVPHWV